MKETPKLEACLVDPSAQFLLRFSRLEFAIKEAGLFRAGPHNSAQVNWNGFYTMHHGHYRSGAAGAALAALSPQQQIVNAQGVLSWAHRNMDGFSELKRDVELLKIVRNNLFHGGKHEDPFERTAELLGVCIALMDDIGAQFFQQDYAGIY